MNPALRARVERAVSHRTRARHNAARLGQGGLGHDGVPYRDPFASKTRPGLARLFPIITAAVLAIVGVTMYKVDQRAVEAERRALLGALEERRAGLLPGHEGFLDATKRWIAEAASDAEGADVVDPALKGRGALDAWLRRPAVYVSGPAAELGDPHKLTDAVQASSKDAFLFCLMSPPAGAGEREMIAKVRGVHFGGAKVDDATANVRRLDEARLGLVAVGPAFEGSVRAAYGQPALAKLERELEGAPIEQAKKALAAELLVVVADLPAGAPDRPREARVALVDLASNKVLLRARRRADEPGSSPLAKLHRAEIEGCGLALAVRRGLEE